MPLATAAYAGAFPNMIGAYAQESRAMTLLTAALKNAPDDKTAAAFLTEALASTDATHDALRQFNKNNQDSLQAAARLFDQDRSELETKRVGLLKNYTDEITRLTTAKNLIETDANAPSPLNDPMAKKVHDERIEKLKKNVVNLTAEIGKLQSRATRLDEKVANVTLKNTTHSYPAIVISKNPTKNQKQQTEILNAENFLKNSQNKNSTATQKNHLITDKDNIDKHCVTPFANSKFNSASEKFSENMLTLNKVLHDIAALEEKIVSPESETNYKEAHQQQLKAASDLMMRFENQLKDENARVLLLLAAEKNQLKFKTTVANLIAVDKKIAQTSNEKPQFKPGLIAKLTELDFFKKDDLTINVTPLGKNCNITYWEKNNQGEYKEKTLTDGKNPIVLTIAEIKDVAAKISQQQLEAWQKDPARRKSEPKPKPIELSKDFFGPSWSYKCHSSERRDEFLKGLQTANTAKLAVQQMQTTSMITQNQASAAPAIVPATPTPGVPASSVTTAAITDVIYGKIQSSNFVSALKDFNDNNDNKAFFNRADCDKLLTAVREKQNPPSYDAQLLINGLEKQKLVAPTAATAPTPTTTAR